MSRSLKILKIPKVAHARLAQKGECQTWNQRSQVQCSLRVTFCYWIFLFHAGNPQAPRTEAQQCQNVFLTTCVQTSRT